tara:strand:- start:109 stop:465 length:357 start_codon:yes stop_codon:yes gene_type:complete
MATISIQFPTPINISAQVGDTAYFSDTTTVGGFSVNNNLNLIGIIDSITVTTANTTIVCQFDQDTPSPTQTSFIFFSKDNLVNTSSLLGYYGEVTFVNSSVKKAEMYATACEVTESSK